MPEKGDYALLELIASAGVSSDLSKVDLPTACTAEITGLGSLEVEIVAAEH